ncbi:MAG: DUF423 domain-containing protein [Balneolaceae bacterium]|nr:MAG: DUF423 domain-containing protein [Balneolaceae bacterium]
MSSKHLLIIGSTLMALAVAFGAFGAHVVQDLLTPERFGVYQTAVQYHFYHALGLLIAGILSLWIRDSKWLKWSGIMMMAGILVFSGSLYVLTLTDSGWLGMITPLGGLVFILGWIFLAIAVFKHHEPA